MRTKWAIFRGPSIDGSYQVLVHLSGFREEDLNGHPSDSKSSHGLLAGYAKKELKT